MAQSEFIVFPLILYIFICVPLTAQYLPRYVYPYTMYAPYPYRHVPFPNDPYLNVPTEIIDLGPDEEFPDLTSNYVKNIVPNRKFIGEPTLKLPETYNPERTVYPKYFFQNPNNQYPLGYFVIPAKNDIDQNNGIPDKGTVVSNGDDVQRTVQQNPYYKITQTSQKFESTNVEPTRTVSTTTDIKPIQTVITRYFDKKNNKTVVSVQTSGDPEAVQVGDGNGNVISKKVMTNVSPEAHHTIFSESKDTKPQHHDYKSESSVQESTTIMTTTEVVDDEEDSTNPNPVGILSWFQ